jgi:hypothetical protein
VHRSAPFVSCCLALVLSACSPANDRPPPSPVGAGISIDGMPDGSDPLAFAALSAWEQDVIFWHLADAPVGLTYSRAHHAVVSAFDQWAAVTPLTFREVDDPLDADIVLDVRPPGDHADICPFAPTTIAHAFLPGDDPICPFGEIHFNAAWWFTAGYRPGPTSPIDYQTIALHEIGHALGLGHSDHPDAVMWPDYSGSRRTLHPDDIQGIQALYGPASSDDQEWVGIPFWTGDICVSAGTTVQACLPTTGLKGQTILFAPQELDEHSTTTAALIEVVISDQDYDPVSKVYISCALWEAVWQPDGPGHPEYMLLAAVKDTIRSSQPKEPHLLHVGKTAAPEVCPL